MPDVVVNLKLLAVEISEILAFPAAICSRPKVADDVISRLQCRYFSGLPCCEFLSHLCNALTTVRPIRPLLLGQKVKMSYDLQQQQMKRLNLFEIG